MPDAPAPEDCIGGVRLFPVYLVAILVGSLVSPGSEAAYDSAFGGAERDQAAIR